MCRTACLLLLFGLPAPPARGNDLPPGAVARLGDPCFRAGGPVEHLALSPDGKQYATARRDGDDVAVAVWDAATGRPRRERAFPRERFGGLLWGPNGAVPVAHPGARHLDFRLAPGGSRAAARWRSADGAKHAVHVFELTAAGVPEQVGTLDLGAEGADEFLISDDGTVVTLRRLDGDSDDRTDQYAATAWDREGRPAKPVPVRAARGGRPLLAPDARELVLPTAYSDAWGFDVFDLATRTARTLARWKPAPAAGGGAAAFSPDGRLLAVAVGRKTHLIDVEGGRALGTLEGHAAAVTAVAVAADGAVVATADEFGLVRLWNVKDLSPRTDANGHRAPVERAELSSDGKRLLTWAADETARLWDLRTGAELRAFAGVPAGGRPTLTPDGTTLLFRTPDRLVARDLQTGLEVPLDGEPTESARGELTARTPDGRMQADAAGGAVRLVEAATGQVRRELGGHRGPARVLGFTPDGSKLLTAGADHTVLVWDVRLQGVPLPDALKNETNAAKLWDRLAAGDAGDAYLAMARLSREPDAAVRMARLRLKPARAGAPETDAGNAADARAVELLDALATDESRALLKELAGGHADALRTRAAKRALERDAR